MPCVSSDEVDALMIVDASVWVAVFRANDAHHANSVAFLEAAIGAQDSLDVPNLVLAEIAGVFSRQTGEARLASRTVRAVLSLPRLECHELNDSLAEHAAELAARCRLRGADAVYVALAESLRSPLITLDNEILERSARVVSSATPADWLRSKSSR